MRISVVDAPCFRRHVQRQPRPHPMREKALPVWVPFAPKPTQTWKPLLPNCPIQWSKQKHEGGVPRSPDSRKHQGIT